MIVFLPHCGFLSEVSRSLEIARALAARGAPVCFAVRGGAHAHLVTESGFPVHDLGTEAGADDLPRFVRALSTMDGREPLFLDGELERAVAAEVELFAAVGARLAVTGFTLSAYLSTRVAGIPLATDHGGSFVPPVLARWLCPAPVNPPDPGMAKLPPAIQRRLINRVPAFMRKGVAPLNAHADALGVERIPGMLGLMCGDLTLVTELPEVLGLSPDDIEQWRPRWPFRLRSGTTFRCTGPLFARFDLPVPPEVEELLAGDEPVVLVAPTSIEEDLLRRLVAAARGSGAKLLVAATTHDIADLADERTVVCGVLPNHLVMPRVSAVVTMGGQGSVQTAIASGTPFVGLPLHPEQELNVGVAERLGVAIRMSPDDATTPALAHAIRRLLGEPRFAAAATAAAARYDGVDGAGRAADAILGRLGATAAPSRPDVVKGTSRPEPGAGTHR